jgi:energy-coupling factor transporter ATP-binding protein EcfA2
MIPIWPIAAAASAALITSPWWGTRIARNTYQAYWRVKVDFYNFRHQRRLNDLEAQCLEREAALESIRHIMPDENGRLGVTFDGKTYHSLDTNAVFDQWRVQYVDPLAERMLAMEKMLRASNGLGREIAQQLESAVTPDPWAAYGLVDLDQLLGDGQPSIHSLIVGARPIATGGLEVVKMALHDLMHTLVIGASGWGKSTWLRALLYQLARASEPVEIVAVDINGSALNALHGWGKLRYPVARTASDAIAVLQAVINEIERRKGLYEQYPTVEKLHEYNQATSAGLPPWVVVIDEGTNLLNQEGIGEPLRSAVQTARQYGVYILLAGQSAKHSVIDTQVRDNFNTRLCFRTSPTSSRVVLDDRAAGDLGVKGRAIVQMDGRELCELQGPWIAKDRFIAALSNGGARYEMPETERPPGRQRLAEDQTNINQVLNLHEDGDSDTAIAREVFGHGTSFYIDVVREILQHNVSEGEKAA